MYSFSWLGRPIIQLPDDMIRLQEVILVAETGRDRSRRASRTAARWCSTRASAKRRAPAWPSSASDIEIRPHNRAAIEAHPLSPYITLVEGSSIDPATIARVRAHVREGERVLVLLDSSHTKAHVLAELEAYAPLVTEGSYIVAMDGIMEQMAGAPRSAPDWTWNNPRQAALEFAARHREFVIEEPAFLFNEGLVTERVTYWPGGFLRRVAS